MARRLGRSVRAGAHRSRVHADTPTTVLCDGDAGLWRLQREALPAATVVLDWWHVAIRFEHALQTARGLGAGAANADLANDAVRNLERAKWRLWHGRWTGCRRKRADLFRWTKCKHSREIAGIDRFQRHISELLGYLERNQDMLVHYAARRRNPCRKKKEAYVCPNCPEWTKESIRIAGGTGSRTIGIKPSPADPVVLAGSAFTS
jgi:hypothetical protein